MIKVFIRTVMLKKRILFVLAFFLPAIVHAQVLYSLSDCIRFATIENAQLRQTQVLADMADAARRSSENTFIPSLSFTNQYNLSFGRSLDPTTYLFVTNRTVQDINTGLVASMTLFSGFERAHSIRKARLNLQSALLETEKTRNDLALNITALFLNIVLEKEVLAMCKRKIALLQEQETLIRKKVEYNVATQGDLLSIQADIMTARVDLATAKSHLNLSKVSLCELLGIHDWESFDISVSDQKFEAPVPCLWSQEKVLSIVSRLPQMRQAELAVKMAKRDVDIASSAFYPTLRLNVGYGSSYSNVRTRSDGEEYSFPDQLRDNMASYVTLSLSVPILSAVSVSNSVKQKKLAYTYAELAKSKDCLALEKDIRQAIIRVNTAYEKYFLLEANINKSKEALRQTEEKYAAGMATYYDYQMAVEGLFQASTQQIQAKYEYLFRTKILDFYDGGKFW